MSARNLDQLLDEARDLVDDAQKLAARSAAKGSRATLAALQDRADQVQARIAGLSTAAQKKVIQAARHTDEAVRENPYKFLAAAAGVGALLGVLATRRRR